MLIKSKRLSWKKQDLALCRVKRILKLTCDDALCVSNDTVAGQEAGQSHSSSSHLTPNLCNNNHNHISEVRIRNPNTYWTAAQLFNGTAFYLGIFNDITAKSMTIFCLKGWHIWYLSYYVPDQWHTGTRLLTSLSWYSPFVRILGRIHKEVRYPKPWDGILKYQFDKRLESLLLYAIHSPAYCWILKETILFSDF